MTFFWLCGPLTMKPPINDVVAHVDMRPGGDVGQLSTGWLEIVDFD